MFISCWWLGLPFSPKIKDDGGQAGKLASAVEGSGGCVQGAECYDMSRIEGIPLKCNKHIGCDRFLLFPGKEGVLTFSGGKMYITYFISFSLLLKIRH